MEFKAEYLSYTIFFKNDGNFWNDGKNEEKPYSLYQGDKFIDYFKNVDQIKDFIRSKDNFIKIPVLVWHHWDIIEAELIDIVDQYFVKILIDKTSHTYSIEKVYINGPISENIILEVADLKEKIRIKYAEIEKLENDRNNLMESMDVLTYEMLVDIYTKRQSIPEKKEEDPEIKIKC